MTKNKTKQKLPEIKKNCNILDDIQQMYKIIRIDFAGDNILVVWKTEKYKTYTLPTPDLH